MDTLPVNDGVRARKIDVFKDTGGNVLPIGKTIGFESIAVDHDHLARQDIAHEFSTIDIKGAGLRRQYPAAVHRASDTQGAEPLRVAYADELVLRHNRKTECTAHDTDRLKDALLNGGLL